MRTGIARLRTLIIATLFLLASAACAAPAPTAVATPAPEPGAAGEAFLAAGAGAIVRHPSGTQLKVLPGTFDTSTHIRIAEEEAAPLAYALAAPVWSIEANPSDFSKPIELVLPTGDEPFGDGDVFGVYWDGSHWVRVASSPLADGSGLRVLASHFSLWSVGEDPATFSGNALTAPAVLAADMPPVALAGAPVPVHVAVSNLGEADLDGYATVSVIAPGVDAPLAVARIDAIDGADGGLGSTVYVSDDRIADDLPGVHLLDTETLSDLVVPMPGSDTSFSIRLEFFDQTGHSLGASEVTRVVRVDSGDASPDVAAADSLPERIDTVRPLGTPLVLGLDGTASETFDATDTFTGSEGRDVARNWGAYQSGVAGLFARATGAGLEGTTAQRLEAHGAAKLGIERGLTGLAAGEDYHASVSYYIEPPATTDGQGRVRFGVNLSGNEDPASPDILWVEGGVQGEWASLVLPVLTATGEKATFFIELLDGGERSGVKATIDGLEIQSDSALARPDVIVESVKVEQSFQGQCGVLPATIAVQLKNIGGGRASSFDTTITGAGATCGPWRVRGLDGSQVFIFHCQVDQPGAFTIRTVADASNAVGEANENNNWMQQDVTVVAPCPPTATPMPTPTGTLAATSTPAATATPLVTPTVAPTPGPTCSEGSPRCLGSRLSFRYLGADWTLSLDGYRTEPVEGDARWVKLTIWGTLTRTRRHAVETLIAYTGDADIGRMLSLTVIDDHGHTNTADAATMTGPLSVEARLQFEDIRDLWGTFTFEIAQYPAPSSVGMATVKVGTVPGDDSEGAPLSFNFAFGDGCCTLGDDIVLGEPHFPPGVTQSSGIEVMPYLRMETEAVTVSEDGTLLTLDLALRNDDYVALRPSIGPAIVVNGDWSFAAYVGSSDAEPVNWNTAAAVWLPLQETGVPPLTEQAPEPYRLRVYALAPAGSTGWSDPILYLPDWDKAMPLK
ncbi:MAG: CARDB domain-containing protein [Anaerolineae bacterium]